MIVIYSGGYASSTVAVLGRENVIFSTTWGYFLHEETKLKVKQGSKNTYTELSIRLTNAHTEKR